MKKLLFVVSAGLMLGATFHSCSDAEDFVIPRTADENPYSDKLEWVISQANEAVSMFEPASRSAAKRASVAGIKAVVGQASRAAGDTLLYVVNYPDDEGFALISAVDTENPILAYIPEGHYDPEVGTDNPGFNIFMDAATEQAISKAVIRDTTYIAPDSIWMVNGKYRFLITTTEVDSKINPKLDIEWVQGHFFGTYCSNGLCGSGPLAVLSAVAYLRAVENDSTLVAFNFDSENADSVLVKWADIYNYKGPNGALIVGEHINYNMFGKLCRQIGYDGHAVYSTDPDRTFMTRQNIETQLRKYLPEYTVASHKPLTTDAAHKTLPKGLMLMYGTQAPGNYHEWICDGYKYKRTRTDLVESTTRPAPNLMQDKWTVLNSTYNEVYYNYMHWGWYSRDFPLTIGPGGFHDYNGWYSGNVITYSDTAEPVRNIEYCAVTK